MRDLGDAISVWAKAATSEPENRKHLDDLRAGMSEIAKQADSAFSTVSGSDFASKMSEGASQAGEAIGSAASELSQAAAPHVATAFAGLAEVFGMAAQKMGEAATTTAAEPHDRPAPQPPATPQPAAAGGEAPDDADETDAPEAAVHE